MLTDPQTITVSAVAQTLARVGVGAGTGSFLKDDGLAGLTVSHVRSKRYRHTYKFTMTKLTADPFIPAQNVQVSHSWYITLDAPIAGFTNAELLASWTGLSVWLNASSAAIVSKLIAGEN